ncbi:MULTISPECIES: stalk domain-containing protein [Meiothermus]|uniref:stalk domain-containing protein n=1 Tax=Meiothermus TaxID=65551 RepID=UPI0014727491|nr:MULTISPECIES: stalk domain-containing protein [Meiothermus]
MAISFGALGYFFTRLLLSLALEVIVRWFVLLLWIAVGASAQQLATRQLVLDFEGGLAYLNGSPITLNPPARVVEGRALIPVREVARVLGVSLENLNHGTQGVRLGKLELYPALGQARLDGRPLGLNEVGQLQDGVMYVSARALEAALGATVVFDPLQRMLTLTYTHGAIARDTTRPVARFATDKQEYKIGEPVRIIEYSYDPDGQPLSLSFTGREEAYFTPGEKLITLVVTNRAGRSSEPFSRRIVVRPEVMYSARDYALRFYSLGRLFLDSEILSYPVLATDKQDGDIPLLVSNSPEQVARSGVLYADAISGSARLLAYHQNALPTPARLVVLVSNVDIVPVQLKVERLGETAATRVVAVLGQVSLMDFLLAQAGEQVRLEPGQTAALYRSDPLATGQGLNLMVDLQASGQVNLTVAMIEESLLPALSKEGLASLLPLLPNLEPDGIHVRGTFPSALRTLRVRLEGMVGRIVIGDGVFDPTPAGMDALTGQLVRLRGHYGLTYRVVLDGALNTVGAFSPRGGAYAGAIRVNGLLQPVPSNGVLLRPDNPLIFFRETQNDQVTIELIPASGSYLPVNLVVYRLQPLEATRP